MKEKIQKEHSLILLVAYIISVNLRPNTTIIDSIVLILLFGYVIFDKFLEYKKLPDIRAEVFEEINKLKTIQLEKIKDLEVEIKAANASVNKVINLKSLNGVAGSVKF